MLMRLSIVLGLLLCGGPALAACADPAARMERLRGVGLERGSRTVVHHREPPWEAYQVASEKLGHVVVRRDGSEGFAVAFVEVPASLVWRAINDFERQVEDGYLPLRFAKVAGPTPDGEGVYVVQSFKQLGMGRWWFNDVRANDKLAEISGGVLHESFWKDMMSDLDGLEIPREVVDLHVPPLVSTTGAWLVADLGEGCTSVEYFNIAEIGGFLGKVQWVVARRAIRSTLLGMTRLAIAYEGGDPGAYMGNDDEDDEGE